MKQYYRLGVTLLGLLMAPSALFAAAILTVPSGLNPGDHYRIAFVTSTFHDGASTAIQDYDQYVTGVANGPTSLVASLNATWMVIGSTAAVNARDHIGAFTDPIYILDGSLVANGTVGPTGLWSVVHAPPGMTALFHQIDLTETGVQPSGFVPPANPNVQTFCGTGPEGCVYTGTLQNGTTNVPLGAPSGPSLGHWGSPYEDWVWELGGPSGSALNQEHFYGLSSVLTVGPAAVPEPGTISIAVFGAILMLVRSKIFARIVHSPPLETVSFRRSRHR